MPQERLSKFLSSCGVAARRKCDELIQSGRVKVNDISILQPYYRIKIGNDKVTVDDRVITLSSCRMIYVALHKPSGYLSDLLSNRDLKVARSLLPLEGFLYPVGRLDYNSEGLMFFTNDGDFANRVMHPKYEIEREYLAKVKGLISDGDVVRIMKGLTIEGSSYRVVKIEFVRKSHTNSWYKIVLREGKNRMIRRIGEYIGHPVLKLKRVRIGSVKLGSLRPGDYRFLTDKERVDLVRVAKGRTS